MLDGSANVRHDFEREVSVVFPLTGGLLHCSVRINFAEWDAKVCTPCHHSSEHCVRGLCRGVIFLGGFGECVEVVN